jgi:oxygen-independent coproporphyrinogen III oxidase
MSDETFQSGYSDTALYVHIPFCTQMCRYCNFYSEPIASHDVAAVVSALIAEIVKYKSQLIRTVYIGGGSPSCLPPEHLLRLIDKITEYWPNPIEFTVELNPGQVSQETLKELYRRGINRLSIGAQSFNQSELKFLGRGHDVNAIASTVKTAQQIGFDNISLDLIFAIPGSTIESWSQSLDSAIDLAVQHVSAYSLTYEKGTPLEKLCSLGEVEVIGEETDRQMYELAIDELARAGFAQYEISNFAKPEFECQHNLIYWANKPYIGIGPGASSYWQGSRTTNISDIEKYVTAIKEDRNIIVESQIPNEIETVCETAVLNLRRIRGIVLTEFEEQTGCDAIELFSEPIHKYQQAGLIEIKDGRVFLTRKALPIADSILCDFSVV